METIVEDILTPQTMLPARHFAQAQIDTSQPTMWHYPTMLHLGAVAHMNTNALLDTSNVYRLTTKS